MSSSGPVKTLSILLLSAVTLSGNPIYRTGEVFRAVPGESFAVVAGERYAAEAGLAVLESGGNAVDAAVTVGFTLAVTLPRAGNIGGGGFMLFHEAEADKTYALDYREMAPSAATPTMFQDDTGEPVAELSRDSHLSIGVPGTVAGLLAAHERFGTRSLEELMAPAIKLAREGFILTSAQVDSFKKGYKDGRLDTTARAVFFGEHDIPPENGERLVQPDLAVTLERIAKLGRDGFYKGKTAQAIVEALATNGGIMTLKDLEDYTPVWRDPVKGTYRDHTVYSMPPPSSGGIHLIQMLNLLENFPLAKWGPNSGQTIHIMVEVMKRAYADRSEYLGDPDFIDVPQEKLISEKYEKYILRRLNQISITPSEDIKPGPSEQLTESTETAHFSIVDASGNAVSNTTTLNFSFGSGIMAEGTGFLLNNQMDDFSAKPGSTNAYGLVQGERNAVQAGKRPLSSMTPVIILKDGKVRLLTGSPGGSRIINTVLQVILNVIEFKMNVAEANRSPRFHHQWWPDTLTMEKGFSPDTIRILKSMGYRIEANKTIGSAQTISRDKNGKLSASSDPRRDGGTALAH